MSEKVLITPPPEGSILGPCKVCGELAGPDNLNKNNSKDVALVELYASEDTNSQKTTICEWHPCCGAFKGYLTTLLTTRDGLPYAGQEKEKN